MIDFLVSIMLSSVAATVIATIASRPFREGTKTHDILTGVAGFAAFSFLVSMFAGLLWIGLFMIGVVDAKYL